MRLSVFPHPAAAFVLFLGLRFALPCSATPVDWQLYQNGIEDMEFRINGGLNGSPSALETGFSGAYGIWIVPEFPFFPYQGWAESFFVPSNQRLVSAELRISASGSPQGDFEVAVYEFNSSTRTLGTKLASSVNHASDYESAAPISYFDLSSAGANLTAEETYLLTLEVLPGFQGRLNSEAAVDIYPGGSSYFRPVTFPPIPPIPVPEPASWVLLATALGGLLGARCWLRKGL